MRRLALDAASDLGFQAELVDYLLGRNPTISEINAFIRSHFRYRGEIEEVVRTPQMMIETLAGSGFFDGDCDDVSTLAAAILRVYGYPAQFVAIRYDSTDPEFKHVFVETVGDRVIDPTVPEETIYKEIERMVVDVV